jgi:predicted acylesterase/phospholipase RssA
VLASPTVNAGNTRAVRGLVVLADGAQAAFAAGAVAELARRGAQWGKGAGAGLGAQIGVLAVLGEAVEAERRWLRDAELGGPLLRSRLAVLRERLGPTPGALLTADAWTLAGWLDPVTLGEHIAPEMAALPERLARVGRSFAVAVEDLRNGSTEWAELARSSAQGAGELLAASARFPAGWGPEVVEEGEPGRLLWGGAGAATSCPPPWADAVGQWDVVCGFPVPVCQRPALGGSLFELIQRREEARAGAVVSEWCTRAPAGALRLVAPGANAYLAWTGRGTAEFGVEYPLPWERNAELMGGLVRFGASTVAAAERAPSAAD